MRVHLTEAGAITLVEPQVFSRFDILADVQSPQQLERAISRIGCRADERHIWVEPCILRFLSGCAGDSDWEKHFTGMLTYAKVKGWIDELGRVRAHLADVPQPVHVAEADFKAAANELRTIARDAYKRSTGQDIGAQQQSLDDLLRKYGGN